VAYASRALALALTVLGLVGCTDASGSARDAEPARFDAPPRTGPSQGLHSEGSGASRARVLEVLDRHETGSFNHSAAEIVDYHPSSRRVFVVDAEAARVRVLRLGAHGFEGGERVLDPRRDVSRFDAGPVTSLAVSGDLVAVAVGAVSNARRGRVAFYSPGELAYLGSVSVGYAPDMLTFTPDGRKLLVANEGEQVRNRLEQIVADPEGSVSIVDLSRGVERATVAQARFDAFDGRIEEYRNAGVRIPRVADRFFEAGTGRVQLSHDLEPEYIGVAPDGKTAWVSLQENDAVAVLDVEAARFTDILPLGVKDFSLGAPALETLPLAAPLAGDGVNAWAGLRGGAPDAPEVSGRFESPALGFCLAEGESRGHRPIFYALRGAVIERHVLDRGQLARSGSIPLPAEADGWRARGLACDRRDRSFWLGSTRRPALYQLREDGRLARTVDLAGVVGAEASVDALALDAAQGRLFAFVRVRTGAEARAASVALFRVIVLDASSSSARYGAALAEYLLPLEAASGGALPELGGAAFDRGRLMVFARSAARGGASEVALEVDLTGATCVLGRGRTGEVEAFEARSVDELVASYGLVLAHQRRLFVLPRDPGASALDVVGSARLPDGRIAVLGLPPAPSLARGAVGERARAGGSGRAPVLGVVSFDDGNRFDASDRDGAARLRHWPVLGGYMPDGLHALRVNGADYFVTANEGDTRHYDATRLADLELDPARFSDAASLQSRASLGRLQVSALDGDLDGDGDLDEIHAFGARSLSVWTAAGELVSDTGSLFEDVTAAALANEFNSNNDENMSFDTRSDDRGPEPEGLEVAEISGRQYAFVGLERVGGIVVLDVSDPRAPAFLEYVNPRDFSGSAERGGARDLGPEGLRFVPSGESPTGRGVLLVGNEVSGTTTAYDVNL
jgi:choice-of-anchor I-like protein